MMANKTIKDMKREHEVYRVFSGRMLWLHYDEETDGIIASDQGGYILTRGELEEIYDGLNRFFKTCSDDEINQYNAEADERRTRKRLEQAINRKPSGKSIIGYVYLIRAENGLYKIGKAKNLKSRLQPFGVQFPMKWELVCSFKANDYSSAEALLHEKFADRRDIGEWFRLSEDDVEYIKGIRDEQL